MSFARSAVIALVLAIATSAVAADQANLSITTFNPLSIEGIPSVAGKGITFAVTVKNNGPSAASNVVWTDTVPSSVTFQTITQESGSTAFDCNFDGSSAVVCTAASLGSGESASFSVTDAIAPNVPSGTSINDQVEISSSTDDPVPIDNHSSAHGSVVHEDGVSLAVQAPQLPEPGTMVFTVNLGVGGGPSIGADNLYLTVGLPSHAVFESWNQTSGAPLTCSTPAGGSTGEVKCHANTYPDGLATFQLAVNPTQWWQFYELNANASTGLGSGGGYYSTFHMVNTSATAQVTGQPPIAIENVAPDSAAPGTDAFFTVTVHNEGDLEMQASFRVSLNAPAHVSYESTTQTDGPPFGCYDSGEGSVTCSNVFAAHATATFVIAYYVADDVTPGQQITTSAVILSPANALPAVTAHTTVSPDAPPQIAFGASPDHVGPGGTSLLSWTVGNATSVSIDHGIGNQPATGSISVSPTDTTTYRLTAAGPGGTAFADATVVVSTPGAPQIVFSADPAEIAAGSSTTLSWHVDGSDTVSIVPFLGQQPATASAALTLGATTTFTLTASGPGGTASAQITVLVQQPPHINFTATPRTIQTGQRARLDWSVTDAVSVLIEGFGERPASGALDVEPKSTTTYRISATGPGGTSTDQVMVTVIAGPGRRRAVHQ